MQNPGQPVHRKDFRSPDKGEDPRSKGRRDTERKTEHVPNENLTLPLPLGCTARGDSLYHQAMISEMIILQLLKAIVTIADTE